MNDKISVLMPALNREQYISDAINSILNQTYENLKLIIYDDGSTDKTADIISSFVRQDNRIYFIRNKQNKGVSFARNKLLDATDTDIACWQDSDDVSNKYRIEYQLKILEKQKHPMIFSAYQEIDQKNFNNKMISEELQIKIPGRTMRPKRANATAMFHLWAVGRFNENIKLGEEDCAWIAAIERTHGISPIVPFILYFYRLHDDQMIKWMKHPEISPIRKTEKEKNVCYADFITKKSQFHPQVSVLMAAYNTERWIEKAIRSCLNQTFKNLELIIIDDGSVDKTFEIIQRFSEKDNRIRFLRHDKNLSYPVAFNAALKMSQGEYIVRLDSDDWDDPTRIEKSLMRLEKMPICDCVSTGALWGQEGNMSPFSGDSGMIPEIYMKHSRGGSPVNASIVAKKKIYDLVGNFDEKIEVGSDSDWNIRAIMAGIRWGYIPENLYFYRRYPEQSVRKLTQKEHDIRQKMRLLAQQKEWENPINPNRHIEVMVTGDCDQNCKDCSQITFRKKHRGYHADLILIEKICKRSKEIGAKYKWIQFCGGEPLIWSNFEEACEIMKSSGAFRKIRIMTNCKNQERLFKALDAGIIDQVYTESFNSNPEAIKILEIKYREKAIIGHLKFKPLPRSPYPNSLPAKCNCDRLSIIGNNVYPCGNFYEHIHRIGQSLEDYKDYFCTLDDDWIDFFRNVDRVNMDICRYCLANGKIWSQIKNPPEQRTRNIPLIHSNFSRLKSRNKQRNRMPNLGINNF